ncbi:MAG: hypothetical protein V4857_21870 [Pseudomonadota bacterium]
MENCAAQAANHPPVMLAAADDPAEPPLWADLICRHLIDVESTAQGDTAVRFQSSIHQRRIGNVDIAHIEAHGQCVIRTKAVVASDHREHYLLSIQRSGTGVLRQDGREALLHTGEMAFCSSRRSYELAFDASFAQTVIIFPADVICAIRPGVDALIGVTLDVANPLLRVLRDTADRFFETAFERRGAVSKDFAAEKLCHLFAAALAETGFAMVAHPMASQMLLAQR